MDVQKVRSLRAPAGPLLIDPGPPRVVLAFVDPNDDHLLYLPGSGSIGLEPEQLALSVPGYLQAVYGDPAAQPVLERLTALARACARRAGLDVGRVVLCRQPWLPAALTMPDGELIDWTVLCRQGDLRRTGLPATATCVRLDAWAGYLVAAPSSANALPGVHRVDARGKMLGDGIVRCLLQQLAPLSPEDGGQLQGRGSQAHAVPRWLLWACESLLGDYRWGPDYAWRKLLGTIWRCLPSTRSRVFDATLADHAFRKEMRAHIGLIVQTVRRQPSAGQVVRSCALVSALFARDDVAEEIQSLSIDDVKLTVVPSGWLKWLGWSQRESSERALRDESDHYAV